MALGTPVVATSKGAEGLEIVSGEHLLIADDPRQFADHVVRLLGDAALRERLAARARPGRPAIRLGRRRAALLRIGRGGRPGGLGVESRPAGPRRYAAETRGGWLGRTNRCGFREPLSAPIRAEPTRLALGCRFPMGLMQPLKKGFLTRLW
jgi:hypothetical protein